MARPGRLVLPTGTLLDTLAAWVTRAPTGYLVRELEAALHVPVKDPLRTLVERVG